MNIGTSLKTISKNQLCSFIGTGGYVELAENDVLSDGSIVTAAAVLPLLNSRNDKGEGILPPGYQRVEFLATSGSNYIELPDRFNFGHEEDMPNSGILLKTSNYATKATNYAFDVPVDTSAGSMPKSNFYIGRRSANERVFRVGLNGISGTYEPYIDSKVYEASINFLNSGIMGMVEESEPIPKQHNPTAYGAPFYILRSVSVCRLYEAHTSSGEELTHSLIPALDPAGEPCTFDTVTKQPFYNAGAGSFRVGIATLQQVRELQLPDNTGNAVRTLYVSLPQEARTDFTAQKHLDYLTSLNWSLNVQYRDGDIPADYTKVDFLQSSGTQRIDTGVLPANDVGIRLMCGNNYVHDGYPAGMSDTTLAVREDFCVGRHFPSMGYATRWGNNMIWSGVPTGAVLGTFVGELNWLNSRMMKSEGGGVTGTRENLPNFSYTTTLTIYLFGRNGVSNEYSWREKIYNGQISRGTDIIRDFIPVLDDTGTPGMYDKINKQFYANSGTGAFVVGIKTLNDARMLNNVLPVVPEGSTYSITLSLPVEASTDAPAQKALKDLADRGWSITVQYREDEIPAGYAKVAFLESSGSQYIDTGIVTDGTYTIGIKATATNEPYQFWCGRSDTWAGGTIPAEYGSSMVYYNGGSSPSSITVAPYTYARRKFRLNKKLYPNYDPTAAADIIWKEGSTKITCNGLTTTMTQMNMEPINTNNVFNKTYWLFKCNSSYLPIDSCIIHNFRMQNVNGEYVYNAIPVINTAGVPGMYDKVSKKFFENDGTGQFRVGLASKEAVRNLYLTPDVQEGTTINLSVPAGTTEEDTKTLKANNPNYTFNIQYRS